MVQSVDSVEMLARRNCASILLAYQDKASTAASGRVYLPSDRPYKCKECERSFDTFQALGGHRASHMKLTMPHEFVVSGADKILLPHEQFAARPVRGKVHECSQCRERFPSGQALGGHMRKHAQLAAAGKRKRGDEEFENNLESSRECSEASSGSEEPEKKKRGIFWVDLNLPAPVDEPPLLQLL